MILIELKCILNGRRGLRICVNEYLMRQMAASKNVFLLFSPFFFFIMQSSALYSFASSGKRRREKERHYSRLGYRYEYCNRREPERSHRKRVEARFSILFFPLLGYSFLFARRRVRNNSQDTLHLTPGPAFLCLTRLFFGSRSFQQLSSSPFFLLNQLRERRDERPIISSRLLFFFVLFLIIK